MNTETVKVTIYLPESLDIDLRVEAARNRSSLSAVAIEALKTHLALKDKERLPA